MTTSRATRAGSPTSPPSSAPLPAADGSGRHHVPGSYPWARRPGRGERRGDPLRGRVRRGTPRAGLPELRIRAHGCAGRVLLPVSLYTSDAADDLTRVGLGGRRII